MSLAFSQNKQSLNSDEHVGRKRENIFHVSVGICSYNEEKNIGRLLEALLSQRMQIASTEEIMVVSCATDGTNDIVRSFEEKDRRIKLIVQEKREGKAAAINLFLKQATGEILVLQSADTLPTESTIENLVRSLLNPKVGMTGGRPIPTNDPHTFMGFVAHLLWKMHHEISELDQHNPKMGELIAFRNVVREIPTDIAVDEAWIEADVRKRGLLLCYAPNAVVYNYGPETVSDFLRQRRRIHAGHFHLKRKMGYETPTMNVGKVLRVLPRALSLSWRGVIFTLTAAFLEVYGRLLGAYDFFVKGKSPYVWDVAETTKEVRL